MRRDYYANGGWETFLSYEDPQQDILIGLLRLRKCSSQTYRPELKVHTTVSILIVSPYLKGACSIVRELHVYGSVVPVKSRDPGKFQHQGFGTLLMEEAARIAKFEHKSSKIAVISGIQYIDIVQSSFWLVFTFLSLCSMILSYLCVHHVQHRCWNAWILPQAWV